MSTTASTSKTPPASNSTPQPVDTAEQQPPSVNNDKENGEADSSSGPRGVEDLQLPLSVVSKIIKDALPQGVIVSKEARIAISKAASIFVLYCTACANNLVMENKRKTLRDTDILAALDEMEFGEFCPQLKENLEGYRRCTKDKRIAAEQRKNAQNTPASNTPISPNTGSDMQAPHSNLTSNSGGVNIEHVSIDDQEDTTQNN